MMQSPKNARFWIWWNDGWVKLTLRPQQTVTVVRSRPTEEGYLEEIETFTHEGDLVRCAATNYGSDCDGPHEFHAEHVCRIASLADDSAQERWDVPENVGIFTPLWQKVGAHQRDVYAEQMGY